MNTTEPKTQMELSLETRAFQSGRRSKKPMRRAGWWFGQMRRTVDRAMDWTPRQASPAHQVYLTLERQTPNW